MHSPDASPPGSAPTPPAPGDLPPVTLTANARQVLQRRYLRRGADGRPVETVEGMFWRVAYHVAGAEAVWGGDGMAAARDFYRLLASKRFFPNSPTFTGAGTPLGQLAACFVLPIADDMGRDPAGIFQTLRDAALIQQTGGGNGFAFSRIRPAGAFVESSAGRATGPIGFLRTYNHAFGEVAQGGTRRGANMAVLRVDHPDIEAFITCKTDEQAITNFNISVGITDAFMRAVECDEDWALRFPDIADPRYRDFNGTLEQAETAGLPIRIHQRVRARDLFDKVVRQAHHNGEPGLLFLDAANRANPVPQLYALEATNPCGEQYLGPYENCCLGSINLAEHTAPEGRVDWDALQATVALSTRFLDDVVEVNAYVPAVPQLAQAAHRARRIGLGIMGLADLMYHAGVRYGSPEGQAFAAQVMAFVRYHAMLESIRLAEARGAFPAIGGSLYDPAALRWAPPELPGLPAAIAAIEVVAPIPPSASSAVVAPIPPSASSAASTPSVTSTPIEQDWGCPALDWTAVVDGIHRHGIRNAAQTTVAPTGTIATVAGCEGYGCEPVFALAYVRHVDDEGRDLALTYASPRFEAALIAAGVDAAARERIIEQVLHAGTCQHIPEVPAAVRHCFVVADDISAEEHVRMQAAIQAFVDNSISKTINFPATATTADVAEAYRLAWQLGCKGLTVYVTGSRDKVVLETRATAARKDTSAAAGETSLEDTLATTPPDIAATQVAIWHGGKLPRPRALAGHTFRVETPLGRAFVTVNQSGEGQPFEVFVNTAKAGSETAAVSEAFGRLISYALRLASPVAPRERLAEIVEQLVGIGGGRPLGFGRNRVRSLPDGVGQVLAEYLAGVANGSANGSATELRSPADDAAAPRLAGRLETSGAVGDICPDCGHAALVHEEGCLKCHACGYSEC